MISTLKRKINVVDSLTSTSAVDALSANQGKVLNEKIISPAYSSRRTLHGSPNRQSGDPDITFSGTISSNGFLQCHVQNISTAISRFIRMQIGGVTVAEISKLHGDSDSTYAYYETGLYPVKAGDTYNIAMNGGNCYVYFYPMA